MINMINKELRKLLIECAIDDKPIYYSEIMDRLGLMRGNGEDHAELSKVLADISRFEKLHNRPLLSAMATYSPATTRLKGGETHGNGFYDLAQQLMDKSGSTLKRQSFAVNQMVEARDFWRDQANYEKHYTAEDDEDEQKNHNAPDFFTEQDTEFLSLWAGKVYEKNNPDHVAAKNWIMDSPGRKTVYWSQQLVKRLTGFDTFNWRMWNQKGWTDTPDGKKRVVKFKHYTWARIFKKGDDYKDIFFTIELNGSHKALVYKIDYYFESTSTLSASQKNLCKQLIPDEVSWLTIPVHEFNTYSWDRLIDKTMQFIQKNEKLYDEIVRSVWKDVVDVSELKNKLIRRELPESGVDKIPEKRFDFQGAEIDWDARMKEWHEIGKIGEEMVIEYERSKLVEANMREYVDDVKKVPDGCGFDILSRYPNGDWKKIEVKSTTRGPDAPFPISITEVAFSELHAPEYALYRVFNLNTMKRVAEFYEYQGNLKNHFLLESVHFNAFKKLKKNK